MPNRTVHSLQVYARVGGALYLIIIILGLYGEVFVRGSLIVAGDAAATAQTIVWLLSHSFAPVWPPTS